MSSVVIIGGGHAAAQLCASLAEAKYAGSVTLVSDEAHLPYHRPPLSKTFIKDPAAVAQLLRPEAMYRDAGIACVLGDGAVAIDRAQRQVVLASGRTLPYDTLVLATGTRPRRLPELPSTLSNVAYLRNATDAERLREALLAAPSVTVLGGGFIGLEVAATACQLGKAVTVFELAPRLLARSVSPEAAEQVAASLREAGVSLRLQAAVERFEVEQDRLVAVWADGQRHAVDLLVAGIGAVPETALAEAAGLACDNGIVVDAHMQTSDPAIYAVGDCTSFPRAGQGRLRLESVQNANDQACTVASVLLGQPAPYVALPWFWSDQGGLRLQIAGLAPAEAERVRRPGAKPGSFSILHFVGEQLVCVESLNAPLDHMAARKLLEQGVAVPRQALLDPAIPLKQHLA